MSDSRLEKFIYAICSMDVSDLPVPLSRIEKLWNCLITGETPDFEPLSRNEKYLMAMLDRYDISNLPAPMSRGEKLLYKIAVGETDLSDVPGYLSRYEELLKYLIENGENSEDDFEYVLYTLNQSLHTLYLTAEKPVKKAIVYGDTLVNTLQESSSLSVTPMGEAIDTQQATITGTANGVIKSAILTGQTLVNKFDDKCYDLSNWNGSLYKIFYFDNLEVGKEYVFYAPFKGVHTGRDSAVQLKAGSRTLYQAYADSHGTINVKFTLTEGERLHFDNYAIFGNTLKVDYPEILILESKYYYDGISFFTGMKSVQMPVLTTTGKNVFDGDNSMELGAWHKEGTPFETSNEIRCKNNFTPFPKGLKNGDVMYIVLSDTSINSNTNMHVYDESKTKIATLGYDSSPYIEGTFFVNGVSTVTIHDASKCKYFSFRAISTNTECKFAIMVNTSAPYEPYKSNILTVNEPIELRGIGDGSNRVEDELDCLTGEVSVVIDEYILTGNENWSLLKDSFSNMENSTLFKTTLNLDVIDNSPCLSADLNNENVYSLDRGGIFFTTGGQFRMRVMNADLTTTDVNGLKTYLQNNNFKFLYVKAQEVIKTVDLTVVDQDGNTVPHLQAFNETTHISTSSAGLFPNVVIPATVSYPSIIKPSTLYTVKLKRSVTSGTLMINVGGTEQAVTSDCFTMTTPSTLTSQDVIFSGKGNVISEVTVVEGDQTSKEYGYFEGMQSVKMPVLTTTGKNIFSPTKMIINDGATYGYYKYKDDESVRCTLSISDKDTSVDISGIYFGMSKLGKNANNGIEWLIGNGSVTQPNKLSLTTNRNFISIYPNNTKTLNKLTKRFNIQLEYGEVKTTYEPYKSNILTTSEEVELRGIGDVHDELDCLTGQVTERIGEIVLNGSENWVIENPLSNDEYIYFKLNDPNTIKSNVPTTMVVNVLTDKLKISSYSKETSTKSNSYFQAWTSHFIGVSRTELSTQDVVGFKEWLSNNNIPIQYPLSEKSIKTVDLTVVNQDNQPTELGTFENVTHVSLEAENLIPEVEMEVATNLLEDTVFNLTDAFNTLYPTAAKPVKGAILSGMTLVNMHPIDYTVGGSGTVFFLQRDIPGTMIKPNTRYFLRLYNTHQSIMRAYFRPCVNNTVNLISSDNKCAIFTTKSEFTENDFNNNKIHFYSPSELTLEDVKDTKVILCEYIEGMENWDIPYFEGMQSVKMPVLTSTGKNLFNIEDNTHVLTKLENGNYSSIPFKSFNLPKFKEKTSYTLSFSVSEFHDGTYQFPEIIYTDGTKLVSYRANKTFNGNPAYILTSDSTKTISHIDFSYGINSVILEFVHFQIEEGSNSTSYEPFKSNILTVNEEVELRGIGKVKDELNLLTGELTERIGESNSENFAKCGYSSTLFNGYYTAIIDLNNKASSSAIKANLVPTQGFTDGLDCGIYNNPGNVVVFKKGATLEEIKNLVSNLIIQYQLAEKSVKTVDLTVQDQNGNETKLGTFDDTTHVLLNSEGLVPEATLTVRTKIPSASSTSLLMDDISTKQERLNTTIDEQSNNVDATMIATTEIFEETL